jgi:hypothetical protein
VPVGLLEASRLRMPPVLAVAAAAAIPFPGVVVE